MIKNLSLEENALLQLLACTLFGQEMTVDFDTVDLEKLFIEAKKQTVLAQAFQSLPKPLKEKNPQVYNTWENYALSVIQNNIQLSFANVELDKLLKSASIPYCTLKGFSSAYYYKEPTLRQMGDIDFLVAPEDAEKTGKLLEENGFICQDENHKHEFHVAYKKGRQLFEMHIGITAFKDYDENTEEFMSNVIQTSQTISIKMGTIVIPSRVAHGVTMLLHLRRHMRDGSGIGLRHFCDWATFADTITDEEWENTFRPVLEKLKLINMAMNFSKTSALFLGMPEKNWFANCDTEVARLLLEDIFRSGNFGRKNDASGQQQVFTDGRNRGKFSAILHHFHNKIYVWKPFYKKHKYLLPIGAIAYCFRMLFLVLFKRKKLNLIKNYQIGSQRSQLYNEIFN